MDNGEEQPLCLSIGERIVWLSDSGPEYGYIRWIGKLDDIGNVLMAGVEFDNPVGSGTGLYDGRQLFVTHMNHASLVPVIGLMKASDFEEPPKPANRTSSLKYVDHENLFECESKLSYDVNEMFDPFYPVKPVKTVTNNHASNTRSLFSQPVKGRVTHVPITIEKKNGFSISTQQQRSYKESIPNQTSTTKKVTKNLFGRKSPSNELKLKINDNNIHNLTSSLAKLDVARPNATIDVSTLPKPSLILSPFEKNFSTLPFIGKFRGIQGNNNSCYLDATLFAMFSSTTLFDPMLYRPPNHNDIPGYQEIQKIIREEIVKPLRINHFVSAEQVMKLRTMLEKSSTVEGLTDEEKDPEEFLSLLLGQILKADPYLKLSTGLESFFYQLIVEKDESVILPTVQDLFEQSFINSSVRLREIPPCLLIQMPRFGRQYKMYPRIMPTLRLDITDVLEFAPRSCGHRGKNCENIATHECHSCFIDKGGRASRRLASITFCNNCFKAKHFSKTHKTGIEDHNLTKTVLDKTLKEALLKYSSSSKGSSKSKEIPRIEMDLFAVLCIETSHYVCFVKCGRELDSGWCFFDSMADRRGEQDGYNIPEVLPFEDINFWTSDKGISYLLNHKDDKLIPEMARRLICDSYMCFYQYRPH